MISDASNEKHRCFRFMMIEHPYRIIVPLLLYGMFDLYLDRVAKSASPALAALRHVIHN